MHAVVRLALTIIVVASLAACGDAGPEGEGDAASGAPSGSKEDQARAVVLKLFDLVKGGQQADAAGLIAYRGKDKKRRWTDSSNYANAEEKRHVDRVCARIASFQEKGAPNFEKFESEKESEGEWLVWHVRFGEGEGAKKAAFACINNAGTTLLGDID